MIAAPTPMLIAGVPRSGTTLLALRCGSHPEMSMTVELGSFLRLGTTHAGYALDTLRHWRRCGGRWRFDGGPHGSRRENHLTNLKFTLGHLRRIRRYMESRVSSEAVGAAEGEGGQLVVGDKLPRYIFAMDRLVGERALIRVVIYRDCRDVTSSFLRKVRGDWAGMAWVRAWDSAEKIAARWVEGIEIMESHADGLHVIRYEDLVQRPADEFGRLAGRLGVSAAGFDSGGIRDTNVGKYSDGLSREELTQVMEVAGPTMSRLGYQ